MKVSDLRVDVSRALSGLASISACLDQPQLRKAGSEHDNRRLFDRLNALEQCVENWTSAESIKESLAVVRQTRSRRRRLARQRSEIWQSSLPIQPYGALHERVPLSASARVEKTQQPSQGKLHLSSKARKVGRTKKRLLAEVASTYETMKAVRGFYLMSVSKSRTDASSEEVSERMAAWMTRLSELERHLKAIRHRILSCGSCQTMATSPAPGEASDQSQETTAVLPPFHTGSDDRLSGSLVGVSDRSLTQDTFASVSDLLHRRWEWNQYIVDTTDADAFPLPLSFPEPPQHPAGKWADYFIHRI